MCRSNWTDTVNAKISLIPSTIFNFVFCLVLLLLFMFNSGQFKIYFRISKKDEWMVRLNQLLWFGEEFPGYRWTVWLLSNDVWTYVNCKWITSWKHASYETVIETCYIGADLFKWHRDCIISAVLLCLTFYQAFWKSRILLSSVLCAAAVFIHISIMLKKFLSCLCTDC